MRVASIQFAILAECVAHDMLYGGVGRRDPRCEQVGGEVMKVPREALELGGKTQDKRVVQAGGPPATASG
jgi:hypothetical protein